MLFASINVFVAVLVCFLCLENYWNYENIFLSHVYYTYGLWESSKFYNQAFFLLANNKVYGFNYFQSYSLISSLLIHNAVQTPTHIFLIENHPFFRSNEFFHEFLTSVLHK